MAETAAHLVVRGGVQGVWFRASTQETAQRLGLAGWVRNRPDGTVEIHAEGPEAPLKELIQWCHQGPPLARVEAVDLEWVEPEGLTQFEIR